MFVLEVLVFDLSLAGRQSVATRSDTSESNRGNSKDESGDHLILWLFQPSRVGLPELGSTFTLNLLNFIDLQNSEKNLKKEKNVHRKIKAKKWSQNQGRNTKQDDIVVVVIVESERG
jgi:hypothetical protein